MTKKSLSDGIAAEVGDKQETIRQIVQKTLEMIAATLAAGGRIELRGFGTFEVKRRAPRLGLNPRTRARIQIPARAVVTFKPGRMMKQRVNALPDRHLDHEAYLPPPRSDM